MKNKDKYFLLMKPTDLNMGIRTSYDKKGQTFNLAFGYRPLGKIISAPIVLRTSCNTRWLVW